MMFMVISIVTVSIDMWQYYSLSYATENTARYASMHGATCAQGGNSCTITIGNAATYFASQALALDASKVNVTFTDGSGSTPCNPLNSCTSSSSQYPGSSNNAVGSDISVSATYTVTNPIAMFWAPNVTASKDYTVGAKSRQSIVF